MNNKSYKKLENNKKIINNLRDKVNLESNSSNESVTMSQKR